MKNFKFTIILTFIFGFFCMPPTLTHASTYQGVQNFLNNNPAPCGCYNWVGEVTKEHGEVYALKGMQNE